MLQLKQLCLSVLVGTIAVSCSDASRPAPIPDELPDHAILYGLLYQQGDTISAQIGEETDPAIPKTVAGVVSCDTAVFGDVVVRYVSAPPAFDEEYSGTGSELFVGRAPNMVCVLNVAWKLDAKVEAGLRRIPGSVRMARVYSTPVSKDTTVNISGRPHHCWVIAEEFMDIGTGSLLATAYSLYSTAVGPVHVTLMPKDSNVLPYNYELLSYNSKR